MQKSLRLSKGMEKSEKIAKIREFYSPNFTPEEVDDIIKSILWAEENEQKMTMAYFMFTMTRGGGVNQTEFAYSTFKLFRKQPEMWKESGFTDPALITLD
jgi:hypothetical protein